MAITRPRGVPNNPEGFISAAPDARNGIAEPGVTLKAKRGISRSQVSVVLADSLLAEIDRVAKLRYMSRSAFITMALHQILSQEWHAPGEPVRRM